MHKVTREAYACKIIRKDGNMNDISSMSTEIEIMKRVRHRNVLSLFELFESPNCLWLILELVEAPGGDLRSILSDQSSFRDSRVAVYETDTDGNPLLAFE